MTKFSHIFNCLILILLFNQGLIAQEVKTTSIKISGDVLTPITLTLNNLDQLKQTEVIRKDKNGNNHVYSGVILSAVLQKAGVPSGKDLHGKNLAKIVLIDASDGYQVVFALAELDKDFTDRTIILADKVDGGPLTATEGPFQVIVQDEKKPARCIRMVTALKVVLAK